MPGNRPEGASITPHRKLAYVVVAYRSREDIAGCLDSIEIDRAGRDWAIVVVDNASPDDSAEVARAHESHPTIVVSDRNVGFGAGCNLGVESVDALHWLFVNPDARLLPGTTQTLLDAMNRDIRCGVVGPAIVDPAGEYRVAAAGDDFSALSLSVHYLGLSHLPLVGRHLPAAYRAERAREDVVGWVSGAAMLVRGDAFREVGGFDPRIFLYMEDVDLCRRLREAGWRIRYEPAATVYHSMAGSQGVSSVRLWYHAVDAHLTATSGTGRARAAALVAAFGMAARGAAYARRYGGDSRQAIRMRIGARVALERAVRRDSGRH